jgi:hypothetical protein
MAFLGKTMNQYRGSNLLKGTENELLGNNILEYTGQTIYYPTLVLLLFSTVFKVHGKMPKGS